MFFGNARKPRKPREEKEYHEQCAFVNYLEILKGQGSVVLFTAIKHNLWTKSRRQIMNQKREGLRPGFPDLAIIINPRSGKKRLIFIEMKAPVGGEVSEFQEAWLKELGQCNIHSAVTKGYEEAKELIDRAIKLL
jgi:hypothetical protein